MKLASEKKMLNTVTRSLLNLKDGDLLTSYLFNYMKNVDDLKVNEFYHGLHFATLSRCQKSEKCFSFFFFNFIAVSAKRIEAAVRNYQGGGGGKF